MPHHVMNWHFINNLLPIMSYTNRTQTFLFSYRKNINFCLIRTLNRQKLYFYQNINLHFFAFPFFFFNYFDLREAWRGGIFVFELLYNCLVQGRFWRVWLIESPVNLAIPTQHILSHKRTLKESCLRLSLGPILRLLWIGLFFLC